MTETAQQVIDTALKLSQADRAQIAEQILRSLDPEPEAERDEAWLAELDRRSAELKNGDVAGYQWSELKQRN